MITYSKGRYREIEPNSAELVICQDENLDRRVCIHWVTSDSEREEVRARLAALQSVQSPYMALVYDLVEHKDKIGVVEEDLPGLVEITETDRLQHLYELSAGLAALHDKALAHGALDEHSFRLGPLGRGRLCNLAFDRDDLDDPSTDYEDFAARLEDMGADQVTDASFQALRAQLATPSRAPPGRVQAIRDRLAALLLYDKHRALAYWNGTSVELGARRRSALFAHPSLGVASVTLQYDGTQFLLANVVGEVLVNNRPLPQGSGLPDSCVIALGAPHRAWTDRYFITFDQSHPEVA